MVTVGLIPGVLEMALPWGPQSQILIPLLPLSSYVALVSPQLSLALSFFICQMDGLDEETLVCFMSCMSALALPVVYSATAPFL